MKYKYNDEWLPIKVPISLPTQKVITNITIPDGELYEDETISMPTGFTYENSRVVGYNYGVANKMTNEDISVTATQDNKLTIKVGRADGDELGDITYTAEVILMKLTTTESTLDNYSTNEMLTGSWIDNKPIYKKVIAITNKTGTGVTVAHNISNLKCVIDHAIKATNNNGVTYTDTNTAYPISLDIIDTTNLTLNISNGFSASPWVIYVTLKYTKTTD